MIPELDLSSPALALSSSAVLGFLVGALPIGLAEVLAVAIGAVRPPSLAFGMLAVFTLAHVVGKTIWYWLGTMADRITHTRTRALIERGRAEAERHPAFGAGVLGISALVSVPPFHLTSIAAGITRYPFLRFLGVCLAGRAVRFGLLAAGPALMRAWLAA